MTSQQAKVLWVMYLFGTGFWSPFFHFVLVDKSDCNKLGNCEKFGVSMHIDCVTHHSEYMSIPTSTHFVFPMIWDLKYLQERMA